MDLSPILQYAIEIFSATVLAAATALIHAGFGWVRKKTDLVTAEHEEMARKYLEIALLNGIAYGKKQATKIDTTFDTTGNPLVDIAAKYVIDNVPDALARLGVTPDKVKALVVARIEDALD